MEREDTAINSYLGHCKCCGEFGAVGGVTDLCWKCKNHKWQKKGGKN